jgi:hypothetical protein
MKVFSTPAPHNGLTRVNVFTPGFLRLLIVHVLTGPDHLSALATLSVGVGDLQQAFFLGIRWGLGHSTGLVLVGIILIALDASGSNETIQVPDKVSVVFDSLMGIFMLFLGAHGIRRAWEKRSKKVSFSGYSATGILRSSSCHEHYGGLSSSTKTTNAHTTADIESYQKQQTVTQHLLPEDVHVHAHSHPHVHHHGFARDDSNGDGESSSSSSSSSSWSRFCSRRRRISARTLAVCAGIIHGLAGPGGVLGVIPAVQLHSGKLATFYLASFCLSSTLTMGIFAIVYGTCSNRLAGGGPKKQQEQDDSSSSIIQESPKTTQCAFLIECLSAFLSLLVGVTWLTLLSLGKLDEFFS